MPFLLVVFNTSGWERTGVVSIELDAMRLYFRDGYWLEEEASACKDSGYYRASTRG